MLARCLLLAIVKSAHQQQDKSRSIRRPNHTLHSQCQLYTRVHMSILRITCSANIVLSNSLSTINYKITIAFNYYKLAPNHFAWVYPRFGRFDTQDVLLIALIFVLPIVLLRSLLFMRLRAIRSKDQASMPPIIRYAVASCLLLAPLVSLYTLDFILQ